MNPLLDNTAALLSPVGEAAPDPFPGYRPAETCYDELRGADGNPRPASATYFAAARGRPADAITHRYLVHSTPRRRLGDATHLPDAGA